MGKKHSREKTKELYKETGIYNTEQLRELNSGINRAISTEIYHNPKIDYRIMDMAKNCIGIIKLRVLKNKNYPIKLRTGLIDKIRVIVNSEVLATNTKIGILTNYYIYLVKTLRLHIPS